MSENISQFYLDLNDHSVYYEKFELNNSVGLPTLVFLHDSWGCVEMWGSFPYQLCHSFNLNGLLYNRRGYGKSSPFAITRRDEYYLHSEAHELIKILDLISTYSYSIQKRLHFSQSQPLSSILK